MVTSQRHQLGLGAHSRESLSLTQVRQSLGHLLTGNIVVKGCDGDIATIHDLGPTLIRVDVRPRVEASERCLAR